MLKLTYVAGTLELRDVPEGVRLPATCVWDERSACFRAPGFAYASLLLAMREQKVQVEDRARAYPDLPQTPPVKREPRSYQREALQAWIKAGARGVVVLPTGAGKTHVAVMAIELRRRATLVVTPTLDLVRQWFDTLRVSFGVEVGIVGGGEHTVRPLTVTTYDSAHIHAEQLGDRFGLLVFDECHHLPGPAYATAAQLSLAPMRLGLTATPERTDGREGELQSLIGPIVYRKDITELAGDYLAEYDTMRIPVSLSEQERQEYDDSRAVYVAYLRSQGLRMSSPAAFSEFLMRASRSKEGQAALAAYRRQRELALAAPAKLEKVSELLVAHRGDRVILFTQDNHTAYAVARRFLVPIITHQTKVRERSEILQGFSSGLFNAIVTSKVLNEGVDVPDANVAVVISGSATVREHVQRLGRILRKKGDKTAILYELVTEQTSETQASERRRSHSAYQGTDREERSAPSGAYDPASRGGA